MNWSGEAMAMIEGAPAAVRPIIRREVESAARQAGLDTVTAAFVAAMRRSPVPAEGGESDLTPFYAKTGGQPADERLRRWAATSHVFADGETLAQERALAAWRSAESSPVSTDRPRLPVRPRAVLPQPMRLLPLLRQPLER